MKSRRGRIILGFLVLLLATVTWAGWETYVVYRGVHNIVGRYEPTLTDEPTVVIPPLNGNQRTNILVLGSDNDRKKEEARPLTQSMIVVSIDPVNHRVDMLSIPRDFYVHIQGHGMNKIDLANQYGGVSLARATVHELFNIPIHHYAWVGLQGFTKVINTFNGVNLDIKHPILDDFYPDDTQPGNPYAYRRVFIPPGWRHLSGRQALEYVRSRHGDLIGDFGRSARQQQILLQLRQKAQHLNGLGSVPELVALIGDLQNVVRTDLDVTQIYQLQRIARQLKPSDIHRVVLQAPTYCQYAWANGQSILRPNWTRIRPVIAKMFAPIKVPPAAPRVQRPTPAPTPEAGPSSTAGPSPTPLPTSTSTPLPTRTPLPPAARLARLPGSLLFMKDGSIAEMTPDRAVKKVLGWGGMAMPALAPNHRSIAFIQFSGFASEIFTVIPANGKWRRLTNDKNKDVHNNLWAAWPTWSPDGKWIVYSSDRNKLAVEPPSEIRPIDLAIWRQRVGGGPPQQLSVPAKGAGGDTEPVWRPQRNQILYVHWAYNQATNEPYSQLALRNLGNHAPTMLTHPDGTVLQASFDPSGRRVTYVRTVGGTTQLVVASLSDLRTGPRLGHARVITSGQVAQPAFSPDGRWISFLRGEGDGFALYLVPAGGGRAAAIPEAGSSLDATSRPVWFR